VANSRNGQSDLFSFSPTMDDTRQPLLSDRQDEDDEREISSPNGRDVSYRRPVFIQPGKFTSLEKLMFFVSSVLLILLSVFAGLYARSALEGKPPTEGPPKSDPPHQTPPADEVRRLEKLHCQFLPRLKVLTAV
jgi:hypothetical protein